MIELRSDTLTRPTPAMREAIASAEVGDEQKREDPTVNRLERQAAELLGHEEAVYVPTATMANEIALRLHGEPGDELLAEQHSHILIAELGGPAAHSGLQTRPLPGDRGRLTPEQIQATAYTVEGDLHAPLTRIVSIENTHNASGGRVWPLADVLAMAETCRELDLRLHLDGARLFNAAVALGVPAAEIAKHADTVTICLSKGLGCPLGALIAGSHEAMRRARRFKHFFGGAMRQAGIVAAAGVYALEHNIDRLAEDHARAKRLAEGFAAAGLPVEPDDVETNFLQIDVEPLGLSQAEALQCLHQAGVGLSGTVHPTRLRAVTHLDVTDDDIERAIEIALERWQPLSAPESLTAELERMVRTAQAEKRLPSVSAAAVHDGEIVWTDAVGLADTDSGVEATSDHQYRIASITKTVTAVGLMQLRDEGRLDLDDTLDRHVPEAAHKPTLRALLAHLSGIQREVPGDVWETLEMPTREELLPRLAESERVLPTAAQWHYSNLAFALLGEVVVRVSGQPAERYLDERVLGPLEMTRTTWTAQSPAAIGYLVDPYADVPRKEAVIEGKAVAPAAELWSTASDLCRWAAFIADPDPAVLAPDTIEEMRTFQSMVDLNKWRLGYGLGFALYRVDDRVFAGHDGAHAGFLAHVSALPEAKTGAAVLTNSGAGVPISDLGIRLSSAVADAYPPVPEEWRPGEGAPAVLEGVLGRWWSEGHEVVLSFRNGKLEALFPDARLDLGRSVFEQEGPDVFRVARGYERGELLRIVRDEAGEPVKLYFATYPVTRTPKTLG